MTGGPTINVDRAVDLLHRGKLRKIFPNPEAIERFAIELCRANLISTERPS